MTPCSASLAEQVRDPIARHAKQPRADVLNRLHQPVRLDELVEDILQDVFRVVDVGHPSADEVPQPRLLPPDCFGDPLILFGSHPVYALRLTHLPL